MGYKICSIPMPKYNPQKFAKPFIAVVTIWPIGTDPVLMYGSFVGNGKEGGTLSIHVKPGDIIRWGQVGRYDRRTTSFWGFVDENFCIQKITPEVARVMFVDPVAETCADF